MRRGSRRRRSHWPHQPCGPVGGGGGALPQQRPHQPRRRRPAKPAQQQQVAAAAAAAAENTRPHAPIIPVLPKPTCMSTSTREGPQLSRTAAALGVEATSHSDGAPTSPIRLRCSACHARTLRVGGTGGGLEGGGGASWASKQRPDKQAAAHLRSAACSAPQASSAAPWAAEGRYRMRPRWPSCGAGGARHEERAGGQRWATHAGTLSPCRSTPMQSLGRMQLARPGAPPAAAAPAPPAPRASCSPTGAPPAAAAARWRRRRGQALRAAARRPVLAAPARRQAGTSRAGRAEGRLSSPRGPGERACKRCPPPSSSHPATIATTPQQPPPRYPPPS